MQNLPYYYTLTLTYVGHLIFQKLPHSHIFLVYGSRMCLMTLFFNITKIIEDVCMKVM